MVKDQVPVDVRVTIRRIHHRSPRIKDVPDVGGFNGICGRDVLNVDKDIHGGNWHDHGRDQGEDKAGESYSGHMGIISQMGAYLNPAPLLPALGA